MSGTTTTPALYRLFTAGGATGGGSRHEPWITNGAAAHGAHATARAAAQVAPYGGAGAGAGTHAGGAWQRPVGRLEPAAEAEAADGQPEGRAGSVVLATDGPSAGMSLDDMFGRYHADGEVPEQWLAIEADGSVTCALARARHGSVVLVEGQPFRLLTVASTRTGKHGWLKVRAALRHLFTAEERDVVWGARHTPRLTMVHVEARRYRVATVEEDGTAGLVDDVPDADLTPGRTGGDHADEAAGRRRRRWWHHRQAEADFWRDGTAAAQTRPLPQVDTPVDALHLPLHLCDIRAPGALRSLRDAAGDNRGACPRGCAGLRGGAASAAANASGQSGLQVTVATALGVTAIVAVYGVPPPATVSTRDHE